MSYSVDTFKDLRNKNTSFEQLEATLTNAEGLALRSVKTSNDTYKIFRYVKGTSDLRAPETAWFRSVVWDTSRNIPVCVAPPKAEAAAPPTGEASQFTLIQDFLDGTMINVFRTISNPDTLEIATRTQLGAGGSFYTKKTFHEMFDDALSAMGLSHSKIVSILPPVSSDTPASFASFLLQHPDHRVVARCRSPRLWCVHTGTTNADGTVTILENLLGSNVPTALHISTYPMTGFRTEADLNSFFKGLIDSRGWFWQGLVFKDGKGRRWRMRNQNFIYLRGLRGSEATNAERFLRLRNERKINEYLKHYSEDRQEYWDLENKLRQATRNVFDAYSSVHKSHEKKLADLPKPIQPFVFRLHAHFLEHLKPQNETVRIGHAVVLVNNSALY